MPNQFGLDRFDFEDAYGKQENNMCSKDLLEFVKKNHLDLNLGSNFNPRLAFGSDADSDHIYNTPRAWYMARYFNRNSIEFDGPNAKYTPISNNIPWSFVPDRKITVEDVKYILSSYYQDTDYNPYLKYDTLKRGIYRPIGINRTGVTSICQIRGYLPQEIQAIEWITYGSNAFNTCMPIYTNVNKLPKYISDVTLDCDTSNLYWQSRLIGALADAHFGPCSIFIERYQNKTMTNAHQILNKYDDLFINSKDKSILVKANEELANMLNKESIKTLNDVLYQASNKMKNGYNRSDN
jgi:dipeptidase